VAVGSGARLFEPFFTTRKNDTGLGLVITRRVALEHHGAVEVRSETGKGSTFGISLSVIVEWRAKLDLQTKSWQYMVGMIPMKISNANPLCKV